MKDANNSVHLLDIGRARAYCPKLNGYLQTIHIRFAFIDPGRLPDGTPLEIPNRDLKQLIVDLLEPITPDDLATALEMLAGGILREANDHNAKNKAV